MLVLLFGLIAVEELNVKGLAAGMLAKSVNDAGWSSFIGIDPDEALAAAQEGTGEFRVPVPPRAP